MNREQNAPKEKVVLSVQHLKTYFYVDKKTTVKAVDDISFNVYRGKVTALVGQSGSGKSVASRAIFNLIDPPGKTIGGEVILNGRDILKLTKYQQKKVYGKEISLIFQEPMSALNPVIKVKNQMMEAIRLHRKIPKKAALEECREALRRVNLKNADQILNQYPFELSGGMCQRVMIAMSMVANPDVLIADEPTTALDLTIQAVVLEELKTLRDRGMAIMLITHDLGVVANVADRIAVMYAGDIVELGTCDEVFYDPRHPYTWALLSSLPQLGTKDEPLYSIQGTPPNLFHEVKGDAFAPRNPKALKIDFVERPPFFEVTPTHYARTWLMDPRAPKVEPPEHVRILREKGVNRVG